MKFQVGTAAMSEAVKSVVGFTGPSNDAKELQCLLVETGDDAVNLTAQNRTSWIKTPVMGARIHEPGSALIPGADLRRWLAACPAAGDLEVEESDGSATLKVGKSICKIATLKPGSYPSIESRCVDPTAVVLAGNEFIRALNSVLFAVEKRENKIINTNVMAISLEDGEAAFVCTDTKAISILQLPASVTGPARQELLPAPAMQLLLPLIEGRGDVNIALSKHECIIRTERIAFGTKLIDSKIMPWRKVMQVADLDLPEKTWLPTKDFLAAVKQAAAADPADLRLEVQFAMGMVGLATKAASAVVDAPACTAECEFAIALEYMADFFGAAARQDLNVTFELGAPKSNMIFLRAGKDWRYAAVKLPYSHVA